MVVTLGFSFQQLILPEFDIVDILRHHLESSSQALFACFVGAAVFGAPPPLRVAVFFSLLGADGCKCDNEWMN